MQIKKTFIDGLFEIQPAIFEDERGFFFESYHFQRLTPYLKTTNFVQDNQSFSRKGVLRGLHFQNPPYAQGKLVRVITGRALDVAVDLRKNSATFGQSYQVILDSSLQNMLYIPEGFAHGFLALEDATFFYKCTNYYHKDSESGIVWNDKKLNIDWGITDPIVSSKDQILLTFDEFKNINLF
jgi:dTDP-4-dehydrorhamnose 3,5-epimerase